MSASEELEDANRNASENQAEKSSLAAVISLPTREQKDIVIQVLERFTDKERDEIAKRVGISPRTSRVLGFLQTRATGFWKDSMGCLVTFFAFFGFAGLIGLIAVLITRNAMNSTQWEQYTYLLSGLETIAFTAIGWLFGKEVHREQAQQAELRANETQKTAMNMTDAAAEEKTKGRILAKGIMAHANDPNMEPLVEMVHSAYPDM